MVGGAGVAGGVGGNQVSSKDEEQRGQTKKCGRSIRVRQETAGEMGDRDV